MKKLKKFSIAAVLTLAFAPCVLAGITDTPPVPGIMETPSAEASGISQTPPEAAPSDLAVNAELALLQLLLVF